jgi:hypothetical protein
LAHAARALPPSVKALDLGGPVQVGSIKIRVESAAWFQRLKLKCDEPLSSFACKLNLRHYSWARTSWWT